MKSIVVVEGMIQNLKNSGKLKEITEEICNSKRLDYIFIG